ncbi:hypothetical protein Q9L58_000166 [Maublancomyces gigas]|uniref:SAP domain-containing protein n=1 Tax=Discina gigas TaxID=1032678 RepID=A0ABR3GY53_9PEZI
MFQMAYGKRLLSAVPRLHSFLPVQIPTFTAAISSSAGSSSSSLLSTESLHARYLAFNVNRLKEQLASRGLGVSGRKLQLVERLASNDVFCARETSTFSGSDTQQDRRWENAGRHYVPAVPQLMETEKPNPLIPVSITPDSRSTRYNIVPEVASTKHLVTPTSSSKNMDELADIPNPILVKEPIYKTEHEKKYDEEKIPAKSTTESFTNQVRTTTSKEDSHATLKATPPIKSPASIPTDTERADGLHELSNILMPVPLEEPTHVTEQHHVTEHSGVRHPMKDATESDISGALTAVSKEDSLLYIMARFPVEVVKDMVEDVFPTTQQSEQEREQKQESVGHQAEAEDGSSQELTKSHKWTLYTIGGLSVGWYFFGY